MDLFVVENGRAMPSTHALLIRPFKTMWEEDEDPAKGDAIRAFTFIELYCSPKKSNPYSGYDPDLRYIKLKEEVYGNPNHTLDYIITDGITKYEELLENASPTYSFLRSCLAAVATLKDFLNKIDLSERTNGGTAVYKPKDITSALKDAADTARNLETLRDKMNNELLDEAKTRKDRQIGYFER